MAHIFISYSKQNLDYARALTQALLDHGFDVWIDERIDYGEIWWDVIVDALKAAGAFIVIMTPESRASRWVQREIVLADNENKPLFPILVAGENFPIFVLTQYLDCTSGALPPDDFYDRLAQRVTPRAGMGQQVVLNDALKSTRPHRPLPSTSRAHAPITSPLTGDLVPPVPARARSNRGVLVTVVTLAIVLVVGLGALYAVGLSGVVFQFGAETQIGIGRATPTTSIPVVIDTTPNVTLSPTATMCEGTQPSRLYAGMVARVTMSAEANNVRVGAGTNRAVLRRLPPGTVFTVTDGPVCADGYIWYEVDGRGWTAEGSADRYWLEPVDESLVPTPTISTASLRNQQIAFIAERDSTDENANNIYLMNGDGSGVQRLTDIEGVSSYSNLSWSPNGRWLAAVGETPDLQHHVVVLDLDSPTMSDPTVIENIAQPDVTLLWSVDGRSLLFYSNPTGGDVSVDLETGELQAATVQQQDIATDYRALDPSMAPDETYRVTMEIVNGQHEIFRTNIDGTTTRLTENPAEDVFPAVAPDGEWIAFSSDRDGDSDIFIVSANGANRMQLTNENGSDNYPLWRPLP